MNTYSTLARRANGIKVYLLFLVTYTMLLDKMTNTYGSTLSPLNAVIRITL